MLNGKVRCWTLMIVGCQVEGLKSWKWVGAIAWTINPESHVIH